MRRRRRQIRRMSNQANNQSAVNAPLPGRDSDLRAAAAGLLSVSKSALSHQPKTTSVTFGTVVNDNLIAASAPGAPSITNHPNVTFTNKPAASRAAGLRSLQEVESLLKSHDTAKTVPPHPLQSVNEEVTPEQERAWKRARSCVYTQRNRAKKSEQLALLERGITFFKEKLGIQNEPTNNKPDDSKKASKLKGVKRNEYLPPEDQLTHMTDKQVTEWKRKERLKRKREANAESVKRQQEHMMQLAIEHEMLHEQYKAKCRETGTEEQEWFR